MWHIGRHAGKHPLLWLLLALLTALALLLLPAGPAHGKSGGHGSGRGHGGSGGQGNGGGAAKSGHGHHKYSAGGHPATRAVPAGSAAARGASSCRERDERGHCIGYAQSPAGAQATRPLDGWSPEGDAPAVP